MKNIQPNIKVIATLAKTKIYEKYIVQHLDDNKEYIFKVFKTPNEHSCQQLRNLIRYHKGFEHQAKLTIKDVDIAQPYSGVLIESRSILTFNRYIDESHEEKILEASEYFYELSEILTSLYQQGLGCPISLDDIYIDQGKICLDLIPTPQTKNSYLLPYGQKQSGYYLFSLLYTYCEKHQQINTNLLNTYILPSLGFGSKKVLLDHYLTSTKSSTTNNLYDLQKFSKHLAQVLSKEQETAKFTHKVKNKLLASGLLGILCYTGLYFSYIHPSHEENKALLHTKKKRVDKLTADLFQKQIENGIFLESKRFLYSSYAVKLDINGNLIPIKNSKRHARKYNKFISLYKDIYSQKSLFYSTEGNKSIVIDKCNQLLTQITTGERISNHNLLLLFQDITSIHKDIKNHFVTEVINIKITSKNNHYPLPTKFYQYFTNWNVVGTPKEKCILNNLDHIETYVERYYYASNLYQHAESIKTMTQQEFKNFFNEAESTYSSQNEKKRIDTINFYHTLLKKNLEYKEEQILSKKFVDGYLEIDVINTKLHLDLLELINKKYTAYEDSLFEADKYLEFYNASFLAYSLMLHKSSQLYDDLIRVFPEHKEIHFNYINVLSNILSFENSFFDKEHLSTLKTKYTKEQERYKSMYYYLLKENY